VESAWSDRHPARVSPDIQRRHEGIPKAIIDRAWDAQLRLCRRYRALIARGKSAQVAIVAIARELAAYVWDIGRMGIVLAAQHNAQSI
jgi:transposase